MSAVLMFIALVAFIVGVFINNIFVFVFGLLGYFIFFIVYHNTNKELLDGGFLVSLLIFFVIFIISLFVRSLSVLYYSLVGFVACSLIIAIYRSHVIKSLPTTEAFAKVVSKHTASGGRYSLKTFYVTFELEEASRKVISVKTETYGLLLEGDNGTLTYKELGKLKIFVNFSVENRNA